MNNQSFLVDKRNNGIFIAIILPVLLLGLVASYFTSVYFEPDHVFRLKRYLFIPFLIVIVLTSMLLRPLLKRMSQRVELELSDIGDLKLYKLDKVGNKNLEKHINANQITSFMFHQAQNGYFFATKNIQGVSSFDLFIPLSDTNKKNFPAFQQAFSKQFSPIVASEKTEMYKGAKVKWQISKQ